jgi:uncharacterized FlaG/YvyC family protein
MYDIKMLKAKKIAELIEIAEQIGIKNLKGQKKQDIIDTIVGKSVDKKSVEVKSESEKNPRRGSNQSLKKIPERLNQSLKKIKNHIELIETLEITGTKIIITKIF